MNVSILGEKQLISHFDFGTTLSPHDDGEHSFLFLFNTKVSVHVIFRKLGQVIKLH